MARRLRMLLTFVSAFVLLGAAPAGAVSKCIVWVWIDGWRCAVGI